MASCWFEGRGASGGSGADAPHRARGAAAFENHVGRIADYLWVAEDGMKMNGYVFIPIGIENFHCYRPLPFLFPFVCFSYLYLSQWYRNSSMTNGIANVLPVAVTIHRIRRLSTSHLPPLYLLSISSPSSFPSSFPSSPPRYNGSQLWDATFACQAIHAATHALTEFDEEELDKEGEDLVLRAVIAGTRANTRAHQFVAEMQVDQDEEDYQKWFRHISKGGWPFSTKDHGWPISDCTAEGLKVALEMGYHYRPGSSSDRDELPTGDLLTDVVPIPQNRT